MQQTASSKKRKPVAKDPTVAQTARLLGVSDTKVRQLIEQNLLAGYPELGKEGGKTRVSRSSIVKYMRAAQRARAAAERKQEQALRRLETEGAAA